MQRRVWPLLVATLVSVAVAAEADHVRSVVVIDATELRSWIDGGRKLLLVDSRVTAEYREGHIPTAINIPAQMMDKQREKFPGDRHYPLVFYCNGWPECKKSHDASAKAAAWGYDHVYWLRDGLPAWQAKHYPLE